MDIEKGCLLAWMSIVFFNRNAKDKWATKRWLPNVPHLANLVRISNAYEFTEKCYEEVVYLGRASGYTFEEFIGHLQMPGVTRGFCAANPINLDDPSDESFEDTSILSLTSYSGSGPSSDRRSLQVEVSSSDASDGATTEVEGSAGSGSLETGAESVDYCACDGAKSPDHCVCD